MHTPKPTVKQLLAGSSTSHAANPAKDDKWTHLIFLMTADLTNGMPRRSGETDVMIKASYPERPMCHNGKYQTESAREVKIDQKTKPP